MDFVLKREAFLTQIESAFLNFPIVALIGPRQCGKTSLARSYTQTYLPKFNPVNYFDLEDIRDFERLQHPMLTLENLEGLVVIDEIQRLPALFPSLRVLVDQGLVGERQQDEKNNKQKKRFLILGSASRYLINQSSESLAGRIFYIEIRPFNLNEVQTVDSNFLSVSEHLWLRGGFPRSFLSPTDLVSFNWRESYVRTYLEQDLPALGLRVPSMVLRRFWMMLAGYHGQIFNASELGRSLGMTDHTVRYYLNILSETFMVRVLSPWFENINKRQVKSPKIYFKDSGILHLLLDIHDQKALLHSRFLGASWEGFALEEVIRKHNAAPEQCYFWSIHGQGELDLLLIKDGKRLGFEFKFSDVPKVTRSMQQALACLNLDQLIVLIPGEAPLFPIDLKIKAVGLLAYLNQSEI